MTVREPTTQRFQAIESELDRLRSIIARQPGLNRLPPQVRIARTVTSGASYPTSGDTFAVIFRDEEFQEVEGTNPLEGDDQSSVHSRFARVIPAQYLAEGTVVFTVELDGFIYIIGVAGNAEYQAECIDGPTDEKDAHTGTLTINKRAMLRLAETSEEGDDRGLLEITPGPAFSVLAMDDLDNDQNDEVVWTQAPALINIDLAGWTKYSRQNTNIWLGAGPDQGVASHKLPPAPARSGLFLMAVAVTGECAQWDWFGPGLDCIIDSYDCEEPPNCQTLRFQNGILVGVTGQTAICAPPEPVPDNLGCPDEPWQVFNPCIAPP